MPILQDAVFSTKYSGPNATSNDKHLSRGGTLSSPSNRVNSYDPDDGQLSLLKTPIGLPSSLDSKARLPYPSQAKLGRRAFNLLRGGTLSSPSTRVNSYDPDDGQLSLLKAPVGLSSSLELVDS